RAECAFKRSNQSPILFASFAHAEGLQHFGSALELDRLAFLLDGQRRQENWNNPVLPERNPKIRMAGDLQNELAVPPFVEELIGRQTADGQATQNERPRTKTKVLISLVPFQPNEFDAFHLTMQLLRDSNVAMPVL